MIACKQPGNELNWCCLINMGEHMNSPFCNPLKEEHGELFFIHFVCANPAGNWNRGDLFFD